MVGQSIKKEKKVRTKQSAGEAWISLLHQAFVRNGLRHTASALLDDCKAVSFYFFLVQHANVLRATLASLASAMRLRASGFFHSFATPVAEQALQVLTCDMPVIIPFISVRAGSEKMPKTSARHSPSSSV